MSDPMRLEVPSAPEAGPRHFYRRVSLALADLRKAMPRTGRAVLDFGAGLASTKTFVEQSIPTGAIVQAWLAVEDSADHTAAQHVTQPITVRAGSIIVGKGFTIYGADATLPTGEWRVAWSWSP